MLEILNQIEVSRKAKEFDFMNDRICMRRFQFAIKCLLRMIQIQKDNSVLCPSTLYEGLFTIYLTAVRSDLEKDLRRLLNLSDFTKSALKEYILTRKEKLKTEADAVTRYYNGDCLCWVKEDSKYFEDWKENFPFDMLEPINFADSPHEKIENINATIKDYTKEFILDPLQLYEYSKNMELILTNILRFKKKEFERISTDCQPDATKVPTPCDRRKRRSFFSPEFEMHVSEFPHKDSNTSLFVLLPATLISGKWTVRKNIDESDIDSLTIQFSTCDGCWKLRNLLHSDTVEEDDAGFSVWPKFEMESDINTYELLTDLEPNLEKLFTSGAINLGNSENESKHTVKIIHHTHVKASEKSTIAGGINVICTDHVSFPGSKTVKRNCSYPFVWFIYEKKLQEILFIGAFRRF